MADKHFGLQFFCRLKFQIYQTFQNYQNFKLVQNYVTTAIPLPLPKKVTPSFPATWKARQGPFFENLVGDSTPQEKRGGAHYVNRSLFKKMINLLFQSHLTFFGTSGHTKSHEEQLIILLMVSGEYVSRNLKCILDRLVGCQFCAPGQIQ